MDRATKESKCKEFFDSLCEKLKETYTIVGSCNKDSSVYLVPIGTESEITYYSKPKKSFRISDHWNWFANLYKCSLENYVQCYSLDMPWPNKRPEPGKASKPKYGWQVSVIGTDGKYHCIFGERFNRKTKEWEFIETNVDTVVSYLV